MCIDNYVTSLFQRIRSLCRLHSRFERNDFAERYLTIAPLARWHLGRDMKLVLYDFRDGGYGLFRPKT